MSTLVLLLVFIAANAADAVTTLAALKRGGVETNPLYGKHPSAGRVWATKAALCLGTAWLLLPARTADIAELVAVLGVSAVLAVIAWRNNRVMRK